MANKMKIKRGLLSEFLLGVLHGFDSRFTLEERLRMATFQQTSRAERIEIMGEDYTYGEVLHRPSQTPEGQRSAKSTTRRKPHTYDVFLWLKMEDADLYDNSSQKKWDDISYGENGVIMSLENEPYFTDANSNQYTVNEPVNQQSHEVVMDNSPLELAHFLNFQITVKG